MDRCGCDFPDDCTYLAVGYPFCAGCGEHHRAPVGDPCPVDARVFIFGWLTIAGLPDPYA